MSARRFNNRSGDVEACESTWYWLVASSQLRSWALRVRQPELACRIRWTGDSVASSQPIRCETTSLTVQGSHAVGVLHSSSVRELSVSIRERSTCCPRSDHSAWVGLGMSARRITEDLEA